jgi:hypothetical protein
MLAVGIIINDIQVFALYRDLKTVEQGAEFR